MINTVILTASGADGFAGTETDIADNFSGIDTLNATGTGSLTGRDVDSIWTLNGTPTYYDGSKTLNVTGFADLQGGAGADRFEFQSGTFGGTFAGNAGNDIYELNGGTFNQKDVDGGAGSDRFVVSKVTNLGHDLTLDNVEEISTTTASDVLTVGALAINNTGSIGSSSDMFRIAATSLEISSGSSNPDVYIKESNSLNLGDINLGAGDFTLEAGGELSNPALNTNINSAWGVITAKNLNLKVTTASEAIGTIENPIWVDLTGTVNASTEGGDIYINSVGVLGDGKGTDLNIELISAGADGADARTMGRVELNAGGDILNGRTDFNNNIRGSKVVMRADGIIGEDGNDHRVDVPTDSIIEVGSATAVKTNIYAGSRAEVGVLKEAPGFGTVQAGSIFHIVGFDGTNFNFINLITEFSNRALDFYGKDRDSEVLDIDWSALGGDVSLYGMLFDGLLMPEDQREDELANINVIFDGKRITDSRCCAVPTASIVNF